MSPDVELETGTPYFGTWCNTNPKSTGMPEVEFAAREGGLTLRIAGGTAADRLVVPAEVFVDHDAATMPEKVMANYELTHTSVCMHGWIKQGVLVLAIFRKFKDGSGRLNYFDREFFYKIDRRC
jgi:hypothetical protein